MKTAVEHSIIIENKKYSFVLTPLNSKETSVQCPAANIDQEFLNEDIPKLLNDLPNLIMAEKNYKEGLIRECRILMSRLYYLEKRTAEDVPKNRGYSNANEKEAWELQLSQYANKKRRRDISIKAYFIRLILVLILLISKNQLSKETAQGIEVNKKERFKRKTRQSIENFDDLLFFFRDAICHPEEKNGEFSPRRSVKYKDLDDNKFMISFFEKETKDVVFQMGDCEIRLSQIRSFFKKI